MIFDRIIIGAGFYGLYSALVSAGQGKNVMVMEYDPEPFMRASYINQARVHMGYHYPRSLSTAISSAVYFNRFYEDYKSCIHTSFQQVYATSGSFSWTNAELFQTFCAAADIYCEEVPVSRYFNNELCDGAFLTNEYTYDAQLLKKYLLDKLRQYRNVTFLFNVRIKSIIKRSSHYAIILKDNQTYCTDFVLNTTYSSINQIHSLLEYEPFHIKYELCEIIICKTGPKLSDLGVTIMDGPFFSIMPFGKTGYHSLTAVTFTPHKACQDVLPAFPCQKESNGACNLYQLGNCNECIAKPESAWPYMSALARKYLRDEYAFEYEKSLFSMKPILKVSEIDDSRPTIIKYMSKDPTFISVLSGKINTVYDLDEVLL